MRFVDEQGEDTSPTRSALRASREGAPGGSGGAAIDNALNATWTLERGWEHPRPN